MYMKRKAVIIDLDGTLVSDPVASGYKWTNPEDMDWDAWHRSRLPLDKNQWCYDIVKNFHNDGYTIIYLTGRGCDGVGRDIATQWLAKHSPTQDYKLIMRPSGTTIADYVMKKEIYETQIEPEYDVLFAIDDKRSVCEMWKEVGVPHLYCGDMDVVVKIQD